MSNGDAVEELARAVDHLSRAEEMTETGASREEIKNVKEQCYDAIDGLINDMALHSCPE